MEQHLQDPTTVRNFVFAGAARVTLRSKRSGAHYSYRVKAPKDNLDGSLFFVSVLSGPDNDRDYRYIGFVRNGRFIHGGGKSFAGSEAPSVVAFGWALAQLGNNSIHPELEVFHEGRCGHCARPLTVPESIATGLGPSCASKLGIPMEQLEKTA